MTSPTSDLSEFDEIGRNRANRPGKCVVARRIDELAAEADRLNVLDAMAATVDGAPKYGGNTIARWWHKRGVRIDGTSVNKHRNGECCCES